MRIPSMKIISSVLFIIVQLAFAAAVSDDAAKCGSLGIMSTDSLPEGYTSADVRACADHPLGNNRFGGVVSLAPKSSADLAKAALNAFMLSSRITKVGDCYFAAAYGCSDGYCWSSCNGGGQWCWLAANGGVGDWLKCDYYAQCQNPYNSGCGQNCKQGSKACGCSCYH